MVCKVFNYYIGAEGVVRLIHLEKLEVHNPRAWAEQNCIKIRQTFPEPVPEDRAMGFLTNTSGLIVGEYSFIAPETNTSASLYVTSEVRYTQYHL